MTGRIIKYLEPVPFHKAMPVAEGVVIWKRDGAEPLEKETEMYDVSRGPYHAILDKMALAKQAETGESYQQCFTQVYTDPANVLLRDGAKFDDLSKAYDAQYGTKLSAIPVAKVAAPPDPLQKAAEVAEFLGPAHAKIHSLAVDHQRAHSGMSFQQAFSHLYSRPENVALRDAIKAEHMRATMARVHG